MRGFKVFELEEGLHFEEKIQYVLLKVSKTFKDKHIVKLDIFLSVEDKDEYQTLIQSIKDTVHQLFQGKIPALTILPNNSFTNDGFSLKCQYIEKEGINVDYKKILDHHFVVIEYGVTKEIISGGIDYNEDNFLMSSQRGLDFVEQILMSENMNFGNIYKQHNYISNINENNISSYLQIQELFYDTTLFKNGFPVITTTGTFLSGIIIDFQAIKSDNDISFNIQSNTENKNLITGRLIDLEQKEIWIANCTDIKANTNDTEKQTLIAFENLFEFIGEKSILHNKFVPLNKANLKDSVQMIDAYVHYSEDLPLVEKLISTVFPGVTKSIIHAPNKNKNVLVELETYINTEAL